MDSKEIRLKNMRELADRVGSKSALARKMDVSPQLIQNYIGKTPTKSIGSEMARRVESAFDLPHGWLDNDHTSPAATADNWPLLGINQAEWELASDVAKGTINAYARIVIDQDLRRNPEIRQGTGRHSAPSEAKPSQWATDKVNA